MTSSLHVAELLRPDDLLDLVVGVVGAFELDTSGAEPVLRRTDTAQPGYLLVALSPQWIGEQAYLEGSQIQPPGAASARINNPSWLVFEIPATVDEIPYTVSGLLDWSALRLLVSPLVSWGSGGPQAGTPPAILAPGLAETALELPYRLVVSPGQDASWVHVDHPLTFGGRTELWHTELAVSGSEPLWAIWSPDFRVPLPQPDDPGGGLTKTSSSAYQRAELVALTVGFGLPLRESGVPVGPAPLRVRRLVLSALGSWLHWEGSWQPLRRPPGWFGRLAVPGVSVPLATGQPPADRRQGTPAGSPSRPALARPAQAAVDPSLLPHLAAVKTTVEQMFSRVMTQEIVRLVPVAPGISTYPPPDQEVPVDLAAWTHIGTGGRDQYVKIVERGWLYPFGNQATQVTITVRRFEADPQQPGTGPVAYLVQYKYIAVTEPEVTFPGSWDTPAGRKMPLASVRLVTLVTPHIGCGSRAQITGAGAIWIVDENCDDVVFHAVGTDRSGREVPFSASLIFMPDSSVETDASLVVGEYARSGSRRECPVPQRVMTYAPPDAQAGQEDTALTTEMLTFEATVSGRTFRPALHAAEVRVPAVSRLTGTDVLMTIHLYADYVTRGIDAVHGVFAELPAPTGVGISADQAGGFLTPNLAVIALQRGFGPVAGKSPQTAAEGAFDPADFFDTSSLPSLDAPKLFDAIPLAHLAQKGGGATAPKLTTSVQRDQAGEPVAALTNLSWQPDLTTTPVPPAGPLSLTLTPKSPPQKGSSLDVEAKITTPLAHPANSTTEVRGTLTSFTIELADVVAVAFTSFSIDVRSRDKPDVKLVLPDKPVTFEGDLAFLNKLAELFPHTGLSDPPYVEVTPTGLVAGFGLALPPAEIGVLALHDLRLDTAFRLPFVSGRPALDLAFSSREHPLVITVAALGGGGFLHLEFDTTGVIMIEGSLEFGGEFALDIGVASGGVHLMAGIYLRIDKTTTPESSRLTGFVDLGGEVSVLGLVSVSVDFHLSLTYFNPPDKARGRATLTVSISIAFFSTSVSMSVERSFGSGPGDPSAADVFPEYAEWQRYALAFA